MTLFPSPPILMREQLNQRLSQIRLGGGEETEEGGMVGRRFGEILKNECIYLCLPPSYIYIYTYMERDSHRETQREREIQRQREGDRVR